MSGDNGPVRKPRLTDTQRLMRRYDRMAEGYQAKIHRQAKSIERLLKALQVAEFGLAKVDEATSIKEARTVASETFVEMSQMLVEHLEDGEEVEAPDDKQ